MLAAGGLDPYYAGSRYRKEFQSCVQALQASCSLVSLRFLLYSNTLYGGHAWHCRITNTTMPGNDWCRRNRTKNRYEQGQGELRNETNNTNNKKDGAWLVLREKDLTVVHEARDSKLPVSAIRWVSVPGWLNRCYPGTGYRREAEFVLRLSFLWVALDFSLLSDNYFEGSTLSLMLHTVG